MRSLMPVKIIIHKEAEMSPCFDKEENDEEKKKRKNN